SEFDARVVGGYYSLWKEYAAGHLAHPNGDLIYSGDFDRFLHYKEIIAAGDEFRKNLETHPVRTIAKGMAVNTAETALSVALIVAPEALAPEALILRSEAAAGEALVLGRSAQEPVFTKGVLSRELTPETR